MNVWACGHLDDTTRAVWRQVFSVVILNLKKMSQATSIVLDSATTKFTPEIPEVFCGFKHFTHPSIGIVVI